ncbi:divalent-cation tolerance protein CutA [Embleya sp. NPDC055664]
MTDYMVVITTTDGSEAAEALARGGVEARVAACAQIVGPIRSVYRWDGRVQDDPEYQVWFKAPADRFEDIRDYILGRAHVRHARGNSAAHHRRIGGVSGMADRRNQAPPEVPKFRTEPGGPAGRCVFGVSITHWIRRVIETRTRGSQIR